MINYEDRIYESFEEILEEKIDDIKDGTIEEHDLVIAYFDCILEPVLSKIDITEIVISLVKDRDDEEGITSDAIIKLFEENINVENIMKQMPSLYYTKGKEKEFDLRQLQEYKDYLKVKEVNNG